MAIPIELTNMCMLSCGGKVLVQNRVDPLWKGITFPGGHVEPGESFTAAVIREFYEETGLTIDNPVLCGVKQWVYSDGSRSISFLYQAERFEGELRSSNEGNVFWVERVKLPHMELASGMEETLRVFFEPTLSELVYFQKSGFASDREWHYEDWDFQLQ